MVFGLPKRTGHLAQSLGSGGTPSTGSSLGLGGRPCNWVRKAALLGSTCHQGLLPTLLEGPWGPGSGCARPHVPSTPVPGKHLRLHTEGAPGSMLFEKA